MTALLNGLPVARLPDTIEGPLGDLAFYVGDLDTLVDHIHQKRRELGKSIAVCATHLFMEAARDPELARTLRTMTFAICDGAPVAWLLSAHTMRSVPRVTGPDVFGRILDCPGDLRVALVGGNSAILENIWKSLRREDRHRVLLLDPHVVAQGAAPDPVLIRSLVDFRPDVVFVGLGCPKQERWIEQACAEVDALFIGVGAAFDYRAGRIHRAPRIMQLVGLEWAYRTLQQPKLFGRYVRTGAPFLLVLAKEVLTGQLSGLRNWSRTR